MSITRDFYPSDSNQEWGDQDAFVGQFFVSPETVWREVFNPKIELLASRIPDTAPGDEVKELIARRIIQRTSIHEKSLPRWVASAIIDAPRGSSRLLDPELLKLAIMDESVVNWSYEDLTAEDLEGRSALHHIFNTSDIPVELVIDILKKLPSDALLLARDPDGKTPLDYLHRQLTMDDFFSIISPDSACPYPGYDNTQHPHHLSRWYYLLSGLQSSHQVIGACMARYGFEPLIGIDFDRTEDIPPLHPSAFARLAEQPLGIPAFNDVMQYFWNQHGISCAQLFFLSGAHKFCGHPKIRDLDLALPESQKGDSAILQRWNALACWTNRIRPTLSTISLAIEGLKALDGNDLAFASCIMGLTQDRDGIASVIQRIQEIPYDKMEDLSKLAHPQYLPIYHPNIRQTILDKLCAFDHSTAKIDQLLPFVNCCLAINLTTSNFPLGPTLQSVLKDLEERGVPGQKILHWAINLFAKRAKGIEGAREQFAQLLQTMKTLGFNLHPIGGLKISPLTEDVEAAGLLEELLTHFPVILPKVWRAFTLGYLVQDRPISLLLNASSGIIPDFIKSDVQVLLRFAAHFPTETVFEEALQALSEKPPLTEWGLKQFFNEPWSIEPFCRACCLLEQHCQQDPDTLCKHIAVFSPGWPVNLWPLGFADLYDWKSYFASHPKVLKKFLEGIGKNPDVSSWLPDIVDSIPLSGAIWDYSRSTLEQKQFPALIAMNQKLFADAESAGKTLPDDPKTIVLDGYHVRQLDNPPSWAPTGAVRIDCVDDGFGGTLTETEVLEWGFYSLEGLERRIKYLQRYQAVKDRINLVFWTSQTGFAFHHNPVPGKELLVTIDGDLWDQQVYPFAYDLENTENTIQPIADWFKGKQEELLQLGTRRLAELKQLAETEGCELVIKSLPDYQLGLKIELYRQQEAASASSSSMPDDPSPVFIKGWFLNQPNKDTLKNIMQAIQAELQERRIQRNCLHLVAAEQGESFYTNFLNCLDTVQDLLISQHAILEFAPTAEMRRSLLHYLGGEYEIDLLLEPQEISKAVAILNSLDDYFVEGCSLDPGYLFRTQITAPKKPAATSSSASSSSSSSLRSVDNYDQAAQLLIRVQPSLKFRLREIQVGQVLGMRGDDLQVEDVDALREDFKTRLLEVVQAIQEKHTQRELKAFAEDLQKHATKCSMGLDNQLQVYWNIYCAEDVAHKDLLRATLDNAIWRAVDLLQDCATMDREQNSHVRTWLRKCLHETIPALNPDPNAGKAMQSGLNDHFTSGQLFGTEDFPQDFLHNYYSKALVPYLILRLDQQQYAPQETERSEFRARLAKLLEEAIAEAALKERFGYHFAQSWRELEEKVQDAHLALSQQIARLKEELKAYREKEELGEVRQIRRAVKAQSHHLLTQQEPRGKKRKREEGDSCDEHDDKRQFIQRQAAQAGALLQLFRQTQTDAPRSYEALKAELTTCQTRAQTLSERWNSWKSFAALRIMSELDLYQESDDLEEALSIKGLIYLVSLKGVVEGVPRMNLDLSTHLLPDFELPS